MRGVGERVHVGGTERGTGGPDCLRRLGPRLDGDLVPGTASLGQHSATMKLALLGVKFAGPRGRL